MKTTALIVDDEPLARDRLQKLLDDVPDMTVIGQCTNGKQALKMIREKRPSLVFLDVQMPELDGFGVLGELQPDEMPLVIFVTAHDKFALKAFEVHAVDFLLKPFDRERFQTALKRAKERIAQKRPGELDQRLAALLAEMKPEGAALERMAVKTSGRVIFIKTADIDWIEAADNYVNLHVGNESHLHRETLTALAERLPPKKFMRISRSTIVNVDRIKELQPLFHGEYAVILRNGTTLTLSRSYRDVLDQLIGKVS
ncbi:MAG TPA: LytTR family DNA-binding domain-containing protein [Verrucomicrobiae bacterium]|nr:LytTR family DNA-binding domain-containing protein [Verrucomicrobiae bacterium]